MHSLMYDGLMLAVFGMGTVFSFLTLLVLVTSLMSAIVLKLEGEPLESQDGRVDPRLLAAITAAVHQHRQNTLH